jgi:hypothetical protein
MDAPQLRNRVAKGLGQAAFRIGHLYDAFRPTSPVAPLARRNFFLRLNVALHGEDKDWHRGARYGQPLWFGLYDSVYTEPGDYLVGPLGTFFVASQPPMLPAVCVQTNRILRFVRPRGARNAGLNGYGGVQPGQEDLLLDGWPASVLAASGGGRAGGPLPGEPGPPSWTVLLPALRGAHAVALHQGDLVTDEAGTVAMISGVELSDLGWRLTTIQAEV